MISPANIAPPDASNIRMTVDVVRSDDVFDSLAKEWNLLADRTPSSTIYQTFEWQRAWWKHFKAIGRRSLYIIAIRSADDLCGIAPCFMEEITIFGSTMFRRLRLLGTGTAYTESHGMFFDDGPSDYLDFLVLPELEKAVAGEIVTHLLSLRSETDELEFLNVPPNSSLRRLIVPSLESQGLPPCASQADCCIRLSVLESMHAYLLQVGGSARRRFSQALRSYHRQEHFILHKIQSNAELESELSHLIALHQARWNELGFPGLFFDERMTRFQREVASQFFSLGRLWFQTLHTEDGCVAARLAFRYHNTMYDYLSGIDANHPTAKYRPGLGLLLAIIEEASLCSSAHVDFLRGNEPYKSDFSSNTTYNWNYRIPLHPRRPFSQRVVFQLISILLLIKFHAARETTLLAVQFRLRGWLNGSYNYFKFRSARLRTRFHGERRDETSND